MDSEGTNGVYMVMDSEVKLFMIIEGVFLCVGDVHIELLANDRLDTGLEIAGLDRDCWISSCE